LVASSHQGARDVRLDTILSAAPLAILLVLAGCNSEPEEVVADDDDPQAEALAQAKPVTLPPAIGESKTYRCKDNSIIYVSFLTDDTTALIRDNEEEPPIATLKAPKAGEPFVSEGFSLSGTGSSITYMSPDSGTQTCQT
jgi:hypothetical protein